VSLSRSGCVRCHVGSWQAHAAGKTKLEALRCLMRRISDALYRQLLADAEQAQLVSADEGVGTGPGGHCGATQESSAVDLPPHIDTSDQPLPGPAKPPLQPPRPPRKTTHSRTARATGDNKGEPERRGSGMDRAGGRPPQSWETRCTVRIPIGSQSVRVSGRRQWA